jgi:hypothetical protein
MCMYEYVYVCMNVDLTINLNFFCVDDARVPDHHGADFELRAVHFHRDAAVSLGNGAHSVHLLLCAEILHQDVSGTHQN